MGALRISNNVQSSDIRQADARKLAWQPVEWMLCPDLTNCVLGSGRNRSLGGCGRWFHPSLFARMKTLNSGSEVGVNHWSQVERDEL